MKFLLVCPLEPESAGTSRQTWPGQPRTTALTELRNRLDVRTVRLIQNHETLATPSGSLATLPEESLFEYQEARVMAAALVRIGTEQVMVLDVSVMDNPALSIVELETLLSDTASDFALLRPGGYKPKWVSRTLLLDDGEEAVPGWIVGQKKELRVDIDSGNDCSEVTLGWANNSVSQWSQYNESERAELIKGLVDAQYIWTEAEALSEGSLIELDAHAFRLKFIRHPVRSKGKAGNMLVALALHNVAYDDVLLNLQGYRREIAKSSLDVWQYPELMARISRRIAEVHRLETERLSESSSKYENLVGNILLAVGLISAAQLVLAVIQTAFSGGTSDVPGGRGDGGLMTYFRNANIDIWMWGSLTSVVAVFVCLIFLRNRVR